MTLLGNKKVFPYVMQNLNVLLHTITIDDFILKARAHIVNFQEPARWLLFKAKNII